MLFSCSPSIVSVRLIKKIPYHQVANPVVDNAFSTRSVTKIFQASITPKVWFINSKYSRARAIIISAPYSSYLCLLRLENNFDRCLILEKKSGTRYSTDKYIEKLLFSSSRLRHPCYLNISFTTLLYFIRLNCQLQW